MSMLANSGKWTTIILIIRHWSAILKFIIYRSAVN